MSEKITPARQALAEALGLSNDILANIELSQIPLENVALKVGRLARLLNDFEMQKMIEYEVGGYPTTASGVPGDVYKLAVFAGRESEEQETKKDSYGKETKVINKYIYYTPIHQLESSLESNKIGLAAAQDAANEGWSGNWAERGRILREIQLNSSRLASRKSFLYHYALKKHYELKFSGVADDIFTRIRGRVDSMIGDVLPAAVQRFNAVYENLLSDNQEDWSNAVHSCRRILQDLADAVFPPSDTPRKKGKKVIELKKDNYINRIMCFVEDSSESDRFSHLVGSHLGFLGERLDSVFQAAQKGSHADIVRREEADRYVSYTYLVVGDILTLRDRRLAAD